MTATCDMVRAPRPTAARLRAEIREWSAWRDEVTAELLSADEPGIRAELTRTLSYLALLRRTLADVERDREGAAR